MREMKNSRSTRNPLSFLFKHSASTRSGIAPEGLIQDTQWLSPQLACPRFWNRVRGSHPHLQPRLTHTHSLTLHASLNPPTLSFPPPYLHAVRAARAIASATSRVLFPPINPFACTMTPPRIPVRALRASSLTPLQGSGRNLRHSNEERSRIRGLVMLLKLYLGCTVIVELAKNA